ncbi:MAG: protein TolQ [Pseudomonadota bacterium]
MHADMSIWGLFMQASLVVKFIMITLLLISFVSWAMIFQRLKILNHAKKSISRFEDRFWSGADLNKLYADISSKQKSAEGLEVIFHAGYKEFSRLRNQGGASPEAIMDGTHRAMRVAMSREVEILEQHLSFLATVGSTTPYIGLFGTVWGIMNSFIALGQVKQATLSMVAPGIAEALIATAMGLFAAIPAVIFYNRFANSVNHLENQLQNFVEEFSGILHRKAHSAS